LGQLFSRIPEKGKIVDVDDILGFVYDSTPDGGEFMQSPVIQDIFTPTQQTLLDDPAVVEVLQHVVANHNITESPETKTVLENCHKQGILYTEVDPTTNTTVFFFPTLMHRR
jgi:hypothetical protein